MAHFLKKKTYLSEVHIEVPILPCNKKVPYNFYIPTFEC